MNGAAFHQPKVIVCVPASAPRPPLRGATQVVADCGHRVWVSPVTLMMRQEEQVETACYVCTPVESTFTGIHPLHREEAKAHGMTDSEITLAGQRLEQYLRKMR